MTRDNLYHICATWRFSISRHDTRTVKPHSAPGASVCENGTRDGCDSRSGSNRCRACGLGPLRSRTITQSCVGLGFGFGGDAKVAHDALGTRALRRGRALGGDAPSDKGAPGDKDALVTKFTCVVDAMTYMWVPPAMGAADRSSTRTRAPDLRAAGRRIIQSQWPNSQPKKKSENSTNESNRIAKVLGEVV